MSTVSPLPLPPFDEPPSEAAALREEIAQRIKQNRRRRGIESQGNLPMEGAANHASKAAAPNPVAAAVARRFEQASSYQEFFAAEAEEARQKAETAAALARRNAEIMAELAADLDEWNARISAANASNPHLHGEPEITPTVSNPFVASTPEPVVASRVASPLPEEKDEPQMVEPDEALPTNLIQFPRQLVAARKVRPRLAEGPLQDAEPNSQLRIFEVEADQIATEPEPVHALPEWSGMRLDARAAEAVQQPSAAVHQQTSFLIPLQPAPLSRRIMAGVVDGCCIALAAIGFAMGVAWASPELPTGKLAAAAFAVVLGVLWLSYQLLSFTLAGQTLGMRYARIGLCTFSDENPTRGAMRMRVLSVLLATFPMGLGLLWAMLDDEGLGWHDRISRMYQRAY